MAGRSRGGREGAREPREARREQQWRRDRRERERELSLSSVESGFFSPGLGFFYFIVFNCK